MQCLAGGLNPFKDGGCDERAEEGSDRQTPGLAGLADAARA